jgi:predicted NBD/HSP70 family sugar kinase
MTTQQTNFIGINVSGNQARAALVDHEGALIESKVAEVTPKQLVAQLAALVEDLRSRGPVAAVASRFPAWSIVKLIA